MFRIFIESKTIRASVRKNSLWEIQLNSRAMHCGFESDTSNLGTDAWLDDKRLFTLRGSFQNLYAYSFTQVQASMSMQSWGMVQNDLRHVGSEIGEEIHHAILISSAKVAPKRKSRKSTSIRQRWAMHLRSQRYLHTKKYYLHGLLEGVSTLHIRELVRK